MPHYEFFCPDCNKFFDKILSLVDYEEGEVQCPHCSSKKRRAALVRVFRHHLEEERLTTFSQGGAYAV